MAHHITLTTTRTTMPDSVAMLAEIKTATGDPTAVLVTLDGITATGKKATDWTPAEIAQAQTILDTTAALTSRLDAQRTIDAYPIHFRALVLALIDELNILRNLHSLAPRTPAQALAAIRSKASTLNGA